MSQPVPDEIKQRWSDLFDYYHKRGLTKEEATGQLLELLNSHPAIAQDPTVLHKAVYNHRVELLEPLVRAGADPSSEMRYAAALGFPECMRELARLGARYETKGPDSLLNHALHGLGDNVPQDQVKILTALRQLGCDLNDPDLMLGSKHVLGFLCAGADCYKLTNCAPPPDPFSLDIQKLYQKWDLRYGANGDAPGMSNRLHNARVLFPHKPLETSCFIKADGNLQEHVLIWESTGMLRAVFTHAQVGRWKDGIPGMIAAYSALPEYVQRGLDMADVFREAPMPREHSVVVAHARGAGGIKQK